MYVADYVNHNVLKIDPKTKEITVFVHEEKMNQPNDLAIAPDEAVYVYSGSLVAYQRFDETVAAFRAVLAAGQKARLIVLTPEVERAHQICADLPAGSVQELEMKYSAQPAEFAYSGFSVNSIPKQGGNRYTGSLFVTGTNARKSGT